jgi:hypothetical protein
LVYVGESIVGGSLIAAQNMPQMPVYINPGAKVPDGESVFVSVKNNTASSIDVTSIAYLRPQEV